MRKTVIAPIAQTDVIGTKAMQIEDAHSMTMNAAIEASEGDQKTTGRGWMLLERNQRNRPQNAEPHQAMEQTFIQRGPARNRDRIEELRLLLNLQKRFESGTSAKSRSPSNQRKCSLSFSHTVITSVQQSNPHIPCLIYAARSECQHRSAWI